MLKRRVLWLAVLLGVSFSAPAASFECRKARTAIEKLICRTPALSSSDTELAARYQRVLRAASSDAERAVVREEQRYWLSHTRNARENEKPDTLASSYARRLRDLRLKEQMLKTRKLSSGCYVKITEVAPLALYNLDEGGLPKVSLTINSLCVSKLSSAGFDVDISVTASNDRNCAFASRAAPAGSGKYRATAKSEGGQCAVTLTVSATDIKIESSGDCSGCSSDSGVCCADGAGVDETFPLVGITGGDEPVVGG